MVDSIDTVPKRKPPLTGVSRLVSNIIAQTPLGKSLTVQSVLRGHPEVQQDRDAVLTLAFEEFCRRTADGQHVDRSQFVDQFPAVRRSLLKLIEVEDFLHDNSDLTQEMQHELWPEVGACFHGFELVEELGRGAMSRVFRAVEHSMGQRSVVAKVCLRGDYEAQTLGRLQHVGVVPVYSVQFDELTQLSVICMPFVSRATLLDVIEQVFSGKRIPHSSSCVENAVRNINQTSQRETKPRWSRFDSYVGAVVDIASQLADALAYTHNKGVFHCDIKPTNVLLTDDGQAMLLDFNLSVLEERRDVALGGTLPYMAPEQLRTLVDPELASDFYVDAQLDLYSLGVTVFEMLSGEFTCGQIDESLSRDEQIELLLRSAGRSPRAICDEKLAWVDPQLRRLVADCLEEDPRRRPPSAEYVARELKSFRTRRGKWRRWLKRNRLAVNVLTCITFLALTIGLSLPQGRNSLARIGAIAEPTWMAAERLLGEGWDSQSLGRYDEAIVSFSEVLDRQPENHSARFARGRCLLITNNEMGALRDFRDVAEATSSPVSYAYLGCCFGRLNNLTLAVQSYKHAHRDGFQNTQTEQGLAHALILHRPLVHPGSDADRDVDFREAETLIRESLRGDSTSPISRWVLVKILRNRLVEKLQTHQARRRDLMSYLEHRGDSLLQIDRMFELNRDEVLLRELTREVRNTVDWALEIDMQSGPAVKYAAGIYGDWRSRPGTPEYARHLELLEQAMRLGAGREWLYRQVIQNEYLAREPRLVPFWNSSKAETTPTVIQYYTEPLLRRDTRIRL